MQPWKALVVATPEVSLSNRTTAVDVASLAVLGAGSDAVELYFEFDDIGVDNDLDSDLTILSDDSDGDRVLRVDTLLIKVLLSFQILLVIHFKMVLLAQIKFMAMLITVELQVPQLSV